MMAFLLEEEFGAEENLVHWYKDLEIDNLLEKGLSNEVFRKYFSITRLQATMHARKATEENLKAATQKDQELIDYSSYLKRNIEDFDERIFNYKQVIERKTVENKMAK